MYQRFIKADIPTSEEMWEYDKTLFGSYREGFLGDNDHPTNETIRDAYIEVRNLWETPDEPVMASTGYVGDVAKMLMAEIEDRWESKYPERPEIEVVETDRCVYRINEAEQRLKAQVGNVDMTLSPPTMGVLAWENMVLVPTSFQLAKPHPDEVVRYTADLSKKYEFGQMQWNPHYLESTLYSMLNTIMFRQLRGESGSGYADFARIAKLPLSGAGIIEMIENVKDGLSQISKEESLVDTHPEWAPFVAFEKLTDIWTNERKLGYYRGLRSVSGEYPLFRLAMVDGLDVHLKKGNVEVALTHMHPNHDKKLQVFQHGFYQDWRRN